jgi:hypothetical protein
MAELKTKPTEESVAHFLDGIEDDKKRKDAFTLLEIFKEVTGEAPVMWGNNIIGFGTYHYKYASGREGDWMITGFSPRKQNLSLYLMCDLTEMQGHLEKIGRHKKGKSCLYINTLDDMDITVLKSTIKESVKFVKEKYG